MVPDPVVVADADADAENAERISGRFDLDGSVFAGSSLTRGRSCGTALATFSFFGAAAVRTAG